jgi:allophanate hydrolase
MSGVLRVEAAGFGVTVQDRGRFGYRRTGVTASGPLDADLARCAVELAGGPAEAAFLEIRLLGPTLRVEGGPLRLALTGRIGAEVRRRDGTVEPFPGFATRTVDDGDRVVLRHAEAGPAHLAVEGGIDVTPVLGSRATLARARLGGLDGRALEVGDALRCPGRPNHLDEDRVAPEWRFGDGPIRVIAGPQDDHFTATARARFTTTEWRATTDLDRMGLRLDGPPLDHLSPEAADIVSDGVVAGAIQVPGDGRPIVLFADCQTVGGYPKIATVISADLPRLARIRPGETVRFAYVDAIAAAAAAAARETAHRRWRAAITRRPPAGRIDLAALLAENLIGGVADAFEPPA